MFSWSRLLRILPVAALITIFLHRGVSAQEARTDELFQHALTLAQQGSAAEAEKLLQRLVDEAPFFVSQVSGSVWYQLAQVQLAQHRREDALATLRVGLDTLQTVQQFDPFLGDAYVRLAIQLKREDSDARITETFYHVLHDADAALHAEILNRLYQQSAFFYPEDQRTQIEQALENKVPDTHPGEIMQQYWRNQDPTPTSLTNERLLEHLRRVEHATEWYPNSSPRGFDDRGMIYVRLGKPRGTASAGLNSIDLRRSYAYRPNEVWFYEHLVAKLYFAFVDFGDKRRFVLVDGVDQAIAGNRISNRWREIFNGETPALDSRIAFYNKLAPSSPIFANRVLELEALKRESVPRYANRRAVIDMSYRDRLDAQYREQVAPEVVVDVLSDVEVLPLQVRTARFLDGNGATRVEVYFGIRASDLQTRKKRYLDSVLVKMAATVEDEQLWPTSTKEQAFMEPISRVTRSRVGGEGTIDEFLLRQLTLTTRLDTFYVSGQVEAWPPSVLFADMLPGGAQTSPENMLKLGSFRSERQQALRSESSPLLISDLQLSRRIVPGVSHPSPNKGDLFVEPYPFKRVNRNEPLFLFFEIYGLTVPEDDFAQYKIAYRAERFDPDQNLWSKLKSVFGGARGVVELESDYETDVPNTQEWIGLNLKAIPPGQVRLTVTVTDETTDVQVSRSTTLELY
ncbi:MAG: GWxTD domain-containing protein [Calditrichaeota bacterium]|nr:MAG: GWxTD domain-containing protein [Calditrichota bacterium]